MIEQEITRLVNQSEKKGRFIIQELDDEINGMEKSQTLPSNHVEKYFSKKTKHSSICNNNKIIHLLHNQSENANLNQNFSTFIFEENSKNWIDFDLVWRKFSQFHCDVSENNMEKIFNYTDLQSDDENNSSYFNDSLNINNNNNHYDERNTKLLLSNNDINLVGDKAAKRLVNPSNDNLTNVQTTHDISHSNIADIGMLSNITSTQIKSLANNEINFNLNLNSNGSNQNNTCNLNCNSNFNINNNKSCGNNAANTNFGIKLNAIGEVEENKASTLLNQTTKNDAICFASSELRVNMDKELISEGIISNVKYEKIENETDQNKLNLTADNAIKAEIAIKTELIDASNLEALAASVKNPDFNSNNNNNNATNLNCNTLILEDIVSSEAAANKNNSSCCNKDIENCENDNDNRQSNKAAPLLNNKATQDLMNTSALNSNKLIEKAHSNSKSNSAQKALNKREQNSPSKIKNLEINFCEKRIINSPAFSPINSDYCHKFDKINLDLNSLVNETNQKKASEKFKLKSSDRLIFLEDYFKEEKNKSNSNRQKRIFSEFNPNRASENKYFSNLKMTNVNNFCFIPENKKILNSKKLRNKKTAKANKKNVNLLISENLEIEITAGSNLDENANDDKENNCFKLSLSEKQNKIFKENFNGKNNNEDENSKEHKNEYVCCICGNKNFIVD